MPQPFVPARPTRRRAIGVTAGAVAALALAGPAHASTAAPGLTVDPALRAAPEPPEPFDEVFRGRRIQGVASAGHPHHGGGYSVRIDGEELHVMRNADATWISVVNHYEPSPTPRALARAAVVELQGAALVPLG